MYFLDKERKVEIFNLFFATVGKNIFELTQNSLLSNDLTCPELYFSYHDDDRVDIFRPGPVDAENVILAIKSLTETRSIGCDGIALNFITDSLYMTFLFI